MGRTWAPDGEDLFDAGGRVVAAGPHESVELVVGRFLIQQPGEDVSFVKLGEPRSWDGP
jgi:hypothetical protein